MGLRSGLKEFVGLVSPKSELGHLLTDERASNSSSSCRVSVSRAVASRKDGNGSGEKRKMSKDCWSALPYCTEVLLATVSLSCCPLVTG